MDLFGIGPLELIVILVVALLILGPEKMVETARSAAKLWGEAQRTLREVTDAATTAIDPQPPTQKPPAHPMEATKGGVARDASPVAPVGDVVIEAPQQPVPEPSKESRGTAQQP